VSRKAGIIARTATGSVAKEVFDGRRQRVLWAEGNGDGDPNKLTIDRTLTSVNGHPTWKIYCGDVPSPIVLGKNEPPHHVVLDDRACYNIWVSGAYSASKLKKIWPFDFDNMGNVKTKRPNRGRPAYLDDSHLELAKGPLRNKTQFYEFSGAPTAKVHILARSIKVDAKENDVKPSDRISLSGALPRPRATSSPSTPSTTGPLTPSGTPIADTSLIYPSRPRWTTDEDPLSNARLKYEPVTANYYVSGPIDGTLKPMGMAQKAMQGSPYFDAACAEHRTTPRPRSGDMAHLREAMKAAQTTPVRAPKRNFITEAFGLNELSAGSAAKRVKVEDGAGEDVEDEAVGKKESAAGKKEEEQRAEGPAAKK
jgi:hypothetical protein